jgi:hypothetical protein
MEKASLSRSGIHGPRKTVWNFFAASDNLMNVIAAPAELQPQGKAAPNNLLPQSKPSGFSGFHTLPVFRR